MNFILLVVIIVGGVLTVWKTLVDIKRSKREVLYMESIYYLETMQNLRADDLKIDNYRMRARLIEIENELEHLK